LIVGKSLGERVSDRPDLPIGPENAWVTLWCFRHPRLDGTHGRVAGIETPRGLDPRATPVIWRAFEVLWRDPLLVENART
jgi:hypothetical protein